MKWHSWRLRPSGSFFGDRIATDEDIRRLFEFCLGRTPDVQSIAEKRGLRLADVVVRLLRSREFLRQVLPSLGTPEDRLLTVPLPKLKELREYASRCLKEPVEKDASQTALLLRLLTHQNSTLQRQLEESSAADAGKILRGLRVQPLLTNERPPSTPLFGDPWDKEATAEDVIQLFRLCLGRSPSETTLETKLGLSVASILIALLESTEFQKIRPFFGARSSKLLDLAPDDVRDLGRYLDDQIGPNTPAASRLSPTGRLSLLLRAMSPPLRERLTSRKMDLLVLEAELAQIPQVSPSHRPISEGLVRALYLLFLARTPHRSDNIGEAMKAGERDLCFRLLYSDEYHDGAPLPLLGKAKLPNEVTQNPPPEQVLRSVATMETISPMAKSKLLSVESWPSLLRLLLADAEFQANHFHPHVRDVGPFRRDLILRIAQESAQELVYGVERIANNVLRLKTRDLPGDSLIELRKANSPQAEFTLRAGSLTPTPTENSFDLQLSAEFDTPRLRSVYISVFSATGSSLQRPTPFTFGPLDSTIDTWLVNARAKLRLGNPIEAEALVRHAIDERPTTRDKLLHARLLAMNGDLSAALRSVESIASEQMNHETRFVRAGLRVSLAAAQGSADEFLSCAKRNYQPKLSTLLSDALRAPDQTPAKTDRSPLNELLGAVLTRAEIDPTALATAASSSGNPEMPRLVVEACLACFVEPQTIWTLLEAFDEERNSLILELAANSRLEVLTPTLAAAPPLRITHPSAALYLAKYLEKIRHLNDAAEFVLRAVALAPTTPETKRLASLILQKAGRIELATQILAEALASSPDDLKSWQRLGTLERQLVAQDPTRSSAGLHQVTTRLLDICAQRLSARPDDDDARLLLAQTLSLSDRWSEARELLVALHDRTSRIELKFSCKLQLAQLCEKLALVAEAEYWARDAQTFAPTAKGALFLAKALRAQDRCDEAQIILDAISDDDDLELLREQPRNLFYQGRFAQAAKRSRENLTRRPGDAHLLLYAAASELEAGDPAAALLLAEQIDAKAESTIFRQDLKLLLFDLHERAGSHSLALGAMNDLFASMGCQEVELAKNPNLHFFDRLQGTGVYRKRRIVCPPVFEGPTVSVIMTAYNAEAHIATAVRSLLTQSYKNIELIVVDDASTDDTPLILQQLAEDDPRVRPVLKTENSGTYTSKNLGLLHATGELVALQDSDDWSHPDRLAKVVAFLMQRPDVVGLTTDWIRMANDGKLIIKAGVQISHVCCISLVFWREKVLNMIGFFDSVRIEADMEYIRRMRLLFGANAVPRLRWPLLFGRYHEDSLTSHSDYGITRTGFTAPRLEYQAEQRKWHSSITQGESAFMPFPLDRRRFVAPEVMLPERNASDS